MTDVESAATSVFNEAVSSGNSRAAAFDQALAVWRRSYPEHTEFRAVADLATALRARVTSSTAAFANTSVACRT
jgi:hypothetical protein